MVQLAAFRSGGYGVWSWDLADFQETGQGQTLFFPLSNSCFALFIFVSDGFCLKLMQLVLGTTSFHQFVGNCIAGSLQLFALSVE